MKILINIPSQLFLWKLAKHFQNLCINPNCQSHLGEGIDEGRGKDRGR